ncbi:MAG: helix-turn-helix transcriptional regulator [Bacteroidota bacterium]
MDFPERLKTIIKVNNLTSSSFADRIGVQRSGVSHILNGRNKPSMEFLLKVIESFPRVDAGWLLTGKSPKKSVDSVINVAEPKVEKGETQAFHPEKPKPEKNRVIEKIVFFYSDRTFDSFNPNS